MLSTVRSHFQKLYEFHLLNPLLVAMFWSGAGLVALLTKPESLPAFLAPAGLLGLLSVYTVFRMTQALEARIEACSPAPWMVEVNGVHVGDLSDARLAAIQREVALDASLYVQQIGNVGRGIITAATSLVTIVPMLCFWLAVAMLVFEPEAARNLAANLAGASPDELRTALLHFARLLMVVGLLAIGLVVTLSAHKGNSLGFRNQFLQAFGERVRRAMECPAAGKVELTRRIPQAAPPKGF